MDVGRKVVEDPIARRAVAPIAARDCGCVANRYEWDSLVYAFYPFWQFAKAGPEAGPPPTVDFELVERIAFDGLSIGADARLRYAPRWTEAAPTFTVSARRHQAKVDLAIRIRGWREWSSAQIEDAAFDVVEELTMRRAADPLVTSGGVFGWLDRYFDRRPDGVTLIVEDYTGLPGEPSARNLVAFVRAISAGLAGTGKTINLAFDIPLVGTPTASRSSGTCARSSCPTTRCGRRWWSTSSSSWSGRPRSRRRCCARAWRTRSRARRASR
jgi:hypothetical protein